MNSCVFFRWAGTCVMMLFNDLTKNVDSRVAGVSVTFVPQEVHSWLQHVWKLKEANIDFQISWMILKHAASFNPDSERCNLCLWEKYFIICRPELATLNRRNELVSSSRHARKYLLSIVREHMYSRGKFVKKATHLANRFQNNVKCSAWKRGYKEHNVKSL